MYKIIVNYNGDDEFRTYIEFQDLTQVFLFINMYEKHTKNPCSYKINYEK
jgi:hypothetical protein